MLENKLQRKNRSISLTDNGMRAIKFLQQNSINVSNYIEKILLNAIQEDFNKVIRGENKDVQSK